MARLYVGNLDARVTAGELEDEFRVFGVLRRSVSLQFAFAVFSL
uniref:RRM domain-containing protein n=1 Tax=Aegilops tauschii subsp. strangulata TaxID=200361 RepID=A0A453PUI3_AEGTS